MKKPNGKVFIDSDGRIRLITPGVNGMTDTYTFLKPCIELVSMAKIKSGVITVKIMAEKPESV